MCEVIFLQTMSSKTIHLQQQTGKGRQIAFSFYISFLYRIESFVIVIIIKKLQIDIKYK